ncbi:MAG: MotA/TolQ/ExbB proton channel family protein [Rhodocyclaceae bacterium]|nr:MotA/TolQ/ExbB proton channel family protein [Rhodocyclaceae bacterium]
MSYPVESAMYGLSQLFMLPVLVLVAALFFYSFYAMGVFLIQARQRARNDPRGFELRMALRADPALGITDLEALAVRKLELLRIVTRVAPMLGLVATMIPMGPALKALADGQLQEVSRNLMVAFSAVILALIGAAITYWIVSVRRRWLATELAEIEKGVPLPQASARPAHDDPIAPLAAEGVQ